MSLETGARHKGQNKIDKREKPLSILFISHSSEKGGAELALLELVRGLVRRKFLCSVVLPAEGYMYDEFNKLGIEIHIVQMPWWTFEEKEEKEDIPDVVIDSCFEIAKIASKKKFDFIYTNTCVIPQGSIVAHMLNVAHIWHIHEYGEKDHRLNFLLDFKERAHFINEYSKKIILNSKALKKYFDQFISKEKSVVVYYNIELPKSSFEKIEIFKKEHSLKLLLIGQIHPGKGQMIAVKALRRCFNELGEDIELAIVGRIGSKEYYSELQKFIQENELADRVLIHEFVENPVSLYQDADVILMCSESEAFGRVTVEAMINGKPVIGTNSGATPELIRRNISGLLYEVGNYEDLANKIDYFYKHRDKISEFGANANEFAKKTFSDGGYSGSISEKLKDIKNIEKPNGKIINFSERIMFKYFNAREQIKINEQIIKKIKEDLQQKDAEINNLNQVIQQKDQEMSSLNQVIQQKDTEIQQRDAEITMMKSSKFWKMRDKYLHLKNKIKRNK